MSAKQSPTLPDFHNWVIQQLVEVVAPNPSAVAAWIIGRWIDEHEDWLAKRRASFDHYLQTSEAKTSTEHKILSMTKSTSQGD